MSERSISLTTLLAALCWTTGLIGAIVNAFIGPDVGAIGAAFLAAATCLTLRVEMRRASRSMAQVFQLGKEAERRHPSGPRGV